MRTALLSLSLLLAACDTDRAIPNYQPAGEHERGGSTSATAPVADPGTAPCVDRMFGPCCFVKTGCNFDPAGGTDCVSPPDEESPGICVPYATCGNPDNVCCDAEGRPGGDALCEYNYRCIDGRCRFNG